jgi:hypothetical protein
MEEISTGDSIMKKVTLKTLEKLASEHGYIVSENFSGCTTRRGIDIRRTDRTSMKWKGCSKNTVARAYQKLQDAIASVGHKVQE